MARPLERFTPGERVEAAVQSVDLAPGYVGSLGESGISLEIEGCAGWWDALDFPGSPTRVPGGAAPGARLPVRVWRVDLAGRRVFVREERPDPAWGLPVRYRPGRRVHGTLTNRVVYGAFVRLDAAGAMGLLHEQDMSGELPEIGDSIEVFVRSVSVVGPRIALSMRPVDAPTPAWEEGAAGRLAALLFHDDPAVRTQGRELLLAAPDPRLATPLAMVGEIALAARCLAPDPDAALRRLGVEVAGWLAEAEVAGWLAEAALAQLAAGELDPDLILSLHRQLWTRPRRYPGGSLAALLCCANLPPADAADAVARLVPERWEEVEALLRRLIGA